MIRFLLVLIYCAYLSINNYAFSQSYSLESFKDKPFPNFALAENGNPAILISIPAGINSIDYYAEVSGVPTGGSYKRLNNSELYVSSPLIFDLLANSLKADLEKLGIKPSVFINVGEERWNSQTDVQTDNSLKQKLHENKANYYIQVVASLYPSERVISKGKGSKSKYRITMLFVQNKGTSVLYPNSNEYLFLVTGLNYDYCFKDLQKIIQTKEQGYFIKQMEETILNKTPFRPTQESIQFPPDLDKQGVLVIKYKGALENFTNDKIKKELDNYPFKSKLVDFTELSQYPIDQYKYLIEPHYSPHVFTSMTKNTANHLSKSSTTVRAETYYIIKNRQTEDVFYGDDLETVINNDNIMPSKALAYLVEEVNKKFASKK